MDPLRWARLDKLFAIAEPLATTARAAFLAESFAADPDPELERELSEMLAAAGTGADSKVDGAIAGGLAMFARSEKIPTLLGPYRIGGEIGRGGMATVYEAERADSEFERKVAVKVLRRGMDTADIVRRLRRERQILANLDHPNIARLLDGGSTEDGRPYVVMEYIDGEPIDRYCQNRKVDLRARLLLFRQICDAVHFAHRNLVLHRDIKPSNILVTAEGQPKLLDFGIAKVLQKDDAEDPSEIEPTLTGLRLLTPEWASPEQVRGAPLSTASDVYSLGLLLYLLVTGRRAYAVDARRAAELERVVCEEEPESPGRGDDLDVVILAALRKEPARRYASAEQLGEDVRRYLENLPVAARKDTLRYRAGKFVRRHRLGVFTVAAVILTLLAAATITFLQAQVAREQKRRAEENLARAEQVASFLTEIFEVSDPSEARGREVTAREVLDQGVLRMRYSLRDDPELRADLLGTMGRVYQKLAFYDDASGLLEEASRLRLGKDGEGEGSRSPAGASSMRDLAALAFERGQLESARNLARQALEMHRRADGALPLEIAKSLRLVADIEVALGRSDEAEKLYFEVLSLQQERLGPEAEEVSETRNSLGELYFRRGEVEKAREVFEEVLAARRRELGDDHPELATSLNNLAVARQAMGDPASAKVLLLEVLALRKKLYGEHHVEVAVALHNLATVESEGKDLPGAIAYMEEALAINRRLHGEEHPTVADNLHNLGMFYQKLGDSPRAGQLYGEALAMRRRLLGEGHPLVAQTLRNLGELFENLAPASAEGYFRQALEIDRHALPDHDPRIGNSLAGLARLAMKRGDLAQAEKLFREEVEIRRAKAPQDWRRPYAEVWLGHLLLAEGRREEALELMRKAVPDLEAALGADHPRAKEGASFLAAGLAAAR